MLLRRDVEHKKLWKGWRHTSCRLGSGSACGSGSFDLSGPLVVVSRGGAGGGVGVVRKLFGDKAGTTTGKEAAGLSTGSATGFRVGRGPERLHSQEWKAWLQGSAPSHVGSGRGGTGVGRACTFGGGLGLGRAGAGLTDLPRVAGFGSSRGLSQRQE